MNKKLAITVLLLAILAWFLTMPHQQTVAQNDFQFGNAPGPARAGTGSPGNSPKGVELSIVRTSSLPVPEAMVVAGGALGKTITVAFSGFLVRHGDEALAFDLGLGSDIDRQYSAEMPYWARPSFRYGETVTPMAQQLAAAGVPLPHDVILSHSHWDHGSGIEDFPDADIWVTSAEMDTIRASRGGAGQPWMSQVGRAGIHWQRLAFPDGPFMGFAESNDVYGDGTVVAVPIGGHTPGSVALFVTVTSGRRFLLVGDALWNAAELKQARGKFIGASLIVDGDRKATHLTVARLARLASENPDIVIIPAHDGDTQMRLGQFPRWLN